MFWRAAGMICMWEGRRSLDGWRGQGFMSDERKTSILSRYDSVGSFSVDEEKGSVGTSLSSLSAYLQNRITRSPPNTANRISYSHLPSVSSGQ